MRRRTTILVAVGVVVAAGGGYVAQRLATGGEVTEIGVEEAVERFRETASTTTTIAPTASSATAAPATSAPATTAPATTAPATTEPPIVATLPAPGVYQYATTGFDQIDTLGGARHDYPAVTTMTVTPHGCGVRLRWDVAEERWESWDWCLDGNAIGLSGLVGYHEFFDVGGRNDYACEGDSRPLDAEPGTTWTMTCTMEGRTNTRFTGTAVERTTLTVAGTEIPVLHLFYDVVVTGESNGTQTIEGWYRTTDGLPVRERGTIATVQPTVIGDATFDESYTIDLLTPTPAS